MGARKKRYSFIDPLLPVWVRLYCRPGFPTDQEVAREVRVYAAARLPRTVLAQPPVRGPRMVGKVSRGATQDIIEID